MTEIGIEIYNKEYEGSKFVVILMYIVLKLKDHARLNNFYCTDWASTELWLLK